MAVIYILLSAHFVADFMCQTDWMALNKSKRWDALGVHVLVYSLVLFSFVAFWKDAAFLYQPVATYGAVWLFIAVNAGAHFMQDAITSRINAWLWQANERHWFFVGIGADQLLHYTTLFVTADWWLK